MFVSLSSLDLLWEFVFVNKFMQLVLGGREEKFGHSSDRQAIRRMFVTWLHNLCKIRPLSSPDLDLDQVLGFCSLELDPDIHLGVPYRCLICVLSTC